MPAPAIPTTLYPVFESSLLVGRELTAATAPAAFTAIPTAPFQPSNKITWLEDDNLRGSNVKVYDLQEGPLWAEHVIPESPCYGDTIGHILFGLLGDYTSTGTAAAPNTTANGAIAAGATSIVVTSGTSFAANMWIQVDVGSIAEIVQVLSVASNTITLVSTTPTRFSHLTGVAVTNTTAPYTHVFSNLNPNSGTGNTSAQPPSYTYLHRNFLVGGGSFNADQFLYTHPTEVKFTAKKNGWFVWDGKATSFIQNTPSANYAPAFTGVHAMPAWRSTSSIGGSSINNLTEVSFTLTREMDIIPTLDGFQQPYVIAAGPMSGAFTADYDSVSNETALNYMLNNTQPTLAFTITNGLAGANLVSFSVNAQLMAHKDAPLVAMKTLWGYKTQGDFLANTTNAGNSGGYSPCQITLINAVPAY